MTREYMGVKEIAELLGVKQGTISHYIAKEMLPEPDVIIGTGPKATKGWTKETILTWHKNRPGRGNHKQK